MAIGSQNGFQTSNKTPTTLSEINVTPLVDVMLVLLIVFMVSAPLMQQGVQVDLPKTAAQPLDDQPEQIVLVITKEKKIMINEHELEFSTLKQKLPLIYEKKTNKEIYIQADQSVPYGFVAQVMAALKLSGITKVGLVTDPSIQNETK
ncbi:MAG: ExbD/TolR family protein [Bacteriovoracia bacterium]